jgi:hypothetical protein
MNGENGLCCDETGPAVRAAIRAIRRKSLAAGRADPYSASIAATNPNAKDPTMNAITAPIATRFAAFAAAFLTSTVVLGATVLGMQPEQDASLQVVALERVVVTAPSIN